MTINISYKLKQITEMSHLERIPMINEENDFESWIERETKTPEKSLYKTWISFISDW